MESEENVSNIYALITLRIAAVANEIQKKSKEFSPGSRYWTAIHSLHDDLIGVLDKFQTEWNSIGGGSDGIHDQAD